VTSDPAPPDRAHAGGALPDPAHPDRALPDPDLPVPVAPPGPWVPVGPLDTAPRDLLPVDRDVPFAVAGRRACVLGRTTGGIDQVRGHPALLAADVRVRVARAEAAAQTPLGVERQLRVDGTTVVERVIVPRAGLAALLEWDAPSEGIGFWLEWRTPSCSPGSRRPPPWNRDDRAIVVGTDGGRLVAFVFDEAPEDLHVEAADPEGGGLAVRARVVLPPGGTRRLAMTGPADLAGLARELRAVARGDAVVQARRGLVARLQADRLTLESADPAAHDAVERAKLEIEARRVDLPGGRTLVAGYGPDDLLVRTGVAVAGALDAFLLGDPDVGRDVLGFLGRHLDGTGAIPPEVGLAEDMAASRVEDAARADTQAATQPTGIGADGLAGYLLLAARYLAWTGDLPGLRAEWPRVTRAWGARAARAMRAGSGSEPAMSASLVPALLRAAESLADAETARSLREAAAGLAGPSARWEGSAGRGSTVPFLWRLLDPEPDAPQGRLVLRPRPPRDWPWFHVRGLAMGDSTIQLRYERHGDRHTFLVHQDRGAAPVRLVLEPGLPGRLRSARVDGQPAELHARAAGDRTTVPVQLVLDHERTVVLDMTASDSDDEART
jgi:hypothetical protein